MNRKETRKQIIRDIVEQDKYNRRHASPRYCKLVPQDKPIDIAREWIRATQKPHPSLTEQRVNEILQEIWEESKNAPTEMIWTGSKEDLEKFLEKFSQL